MLHLECVGDPIPNFFQQRTVRCLRYNSVHEKIVLLCRDVACVINPQDELQRLPMQEKFLGISCIDPQSGEVIVETHDSGDSITSRLKRVSITTAEMTTISLAHLHLDAWDFHPCRLVFLSNGERVVLGVDSKASEFWWGVANGGALESATTTTSGICVAVG